MDIMLPYIDEKRYYLRGFNFLEIEIIIKNVLCFRDSITNEPRNLWQNDRC